MCFTDVANEPPSEAGFCDPHVNPLPATYRLLEGSYLTETDEAVMTRGEPQTFRHSMTFTLSEPGELVLTPHLFVEPEVSVPAVSVSGEPARVSFFEAEAVSGF